MRRFFFILSAAVISIASCRRATDNTQGTVSVTDDYDSLYTAVITDGKVSITFNLEKCERFASDFGMMCRVGPEPRIWEGLDENCVDLVAAGYGEGINPCLTALTDLGHVAFMNMSDAIFTGDFMCSGPLDGFENVKSISASEYGGVETDPGCDHSRIIPECEEFGYYYCDDFEIVITKDWNCYANSLSADFHESGTLSRMREYDADGATGCSRRFSFNTGERNLIFEISHEYGASEVDFRFLSEEWPLTLAQNIRFGKCYASRWAD